MTPSKEKDCGKGPKSLYQQALLAEKNGEWNRAHELIQNIPTTEAALIHAYLHRVEGDDWNADYWYQRAGAKRPSCSLKAEWQQLMEKFEK